MPLLEERWHVPLPFTSNFCHLLHLPPSKSKIKGKQIAVGFTDGFINVYNCEGGDLVSSEKCSEDKIVSIDWVEEETNPKCTSNKLYKDISFFFPPLKFLEDTQEEQREKRNREEVYQSPKMNILVSLDCKNQVKLFAFGTFFLAKVHLDECIKDEGEATRAFLSQDLQNLSILFKTSENELKLLRFDSSVIVERREELAEIADQSANVISFLWHLEKAIKACVSRWKTAISALKETVSGLENALKGLTINLLSITTYTNF